MQDDPDWAPCINLGYPRQGPTDRKRYERATQLEEKRRRYECAEALLALSKITDALDTSAGNHDDGSILELSFDGTETQTELTGNSIEVMMKEKNELEIKVTCLKQENENLRMELLDFQLTEHAFIDKDDKVLFYTGLPNWKTLFCLFSYVSPYLKNNCVLSPFQQLLLTLIRLRLNLSGNDLGYRFGNISSSTVSRIFSNVLNIMFQLLQPLIIWPEREALQKTLPMDFRKHSPNCVVIIDCFELFLERATNVNARAQTYSQYKHHNTVKYLIGITPQGTVSFISEGWGGRASDKHITENCGILEKLNPGDVLLADRGFDIQESVGLYCATVKIPAFTKGKTQLSGIEVEQTRQIANVRIHVERGIGNIRKKYSILNATQPITFVLSKDNSCTTLDKIVHVCSALINICDSVVPFEQ